MRSSSAISRIDLGLLRWCWSLARWDDGGDEIEHALGVAQFRSGGGDGDRRTEVSAESLARFAEGRYDPVTGGAA